MDVKTGVGAKSPRRPRVVVKTLTDLRERAVRGSGLKGREPRRDRLTAWAVRAIHVPFVVVYTVLGIRVLQVVFGVRGDTGFVHFIDVLAKPLYSPFLGVLGSFAVAEAGPPLRPILFAVLSFAVVHGLVRELFRVFGQRRRHS